MTSPRATALELSTTVGGTRAIWHGVELVADELFDDELDLRIDAVRLALLDVVDRLDELVLSPPSLPEEDPV